MNRIEVTVHHPHPSHIVSRLSAALAIILFSLAAAHAQYFTKVTDSANPVVSDVTLPGYQGASWIDYNNDGLLDLFVCKNGLYKNLGNGVFIRDALSAVAEGQGNSWADYDNDGWLDLAISGPKSLLFHNDGAGHLVRMTSGPQADSIGNRGWACAWADYDNDGFVDFVITHPAGFVGSPTVNHLFHNSGDGTFTRVTTTPVTSGLAPYTIATWSDFDNDGDMDLFIGSGPANGSVARDYVFKNELKESGSVNFPRVTTGALATDARDGQIFNWIDYDNDGDLDVYVTNYAGTTGGMPNQLYKNNNGVFVLQTTDSVGPIAAHNERSLSSVWDDFDNDGFIDCLVTNEATVPCRLYMNNRNGTFSEVTGESIVTDEGPHHGAAAGDYDNDGFVDIFVNGPGARGLYHNNGNTNHWLFIKAIGTESNKAAIGARIRILATINGTSVWQMRELSSQNEFDGQNDLKAHFGLGDASSVDSVVIIWPRGRVERFAGFEANRTYTVVEGITVAQGLIPQTAVLLAPVPHSENDVDSTILIWSALPGASGYRVQVARDRDFSTIIRDTVIADTALPPGLTADTGSYYWRVKPMYDHFGGGAWSEAFDFTSISLMLLDFTPRWNLVSLPLQVSDRSVSTIFPGAITAAFRYAQGGEYQSSDTLVRGIGYWLKFPTAGHSLVVGPKITHDTVSVSPGWNLVGTVARQVSTEGVTTEPSDILSSAFFGYSGGYQTALILQPGKAYWVKALQSGVIIF